MATPDEFRRIVLEGLHKDAQKCRGADLEVTVPTGDVNNDGEGNRSISNNDGKTATTSFLLHHNIVAASSRYFATFPEPKMGRVINDVDLESFSICVKFMYTGEYREALTHDNVASILHASELLQIDGLNKNCIEYLEQNLDHSNHEQVVELADRFNRPDLKKSALRFQSKNTSRDELLAKRESLVKDIGKASYEERLILDRKNKLKKQLEKTEKQLKDTFEKQHEQALSSKWERKMAQNKTGGDGAAAASIPSSLGRFRKAGTIGHAVLPETGSEFFWYGGSSTYGVEVEEDRSDYDEERPPPPPTKEQYDKYGIVKSHCSIETAVKAANPGDRIYLAPGVHKSGSVFNDDKILIRQAQEFIGLGRANEVIVEINYGDDKCFSVLAGPVGFYNITFRAKAHGIEQRSDDNPGTSQGSGDDAIISFEESTESHDYQTSVKADFIVKNCTFDLGTDCSTAFPTRVSGIFIKRGQSALIEGCKFLGGAGSAIVALNDPYLYTPSIQITRNAFINNGQPTFSEKSAKEGLDFKTRKKQFVPIPAAERTPHPSSVALWKFKRECYKIRKLRTKETHKIVSIQMVGNKFESNLCAPLAYRALVPMSSGKVNDWKLHDNLPVGDGLKALVQGFDLVVKDNVMNNNGLQFNNEAICRMRGAYEKKEKRVRTEEYDQTKACKFPDGDSLLVIQHFISQYDTNSFPDGWSGGEPLQEFEELVVMYPEYESDSDGDFYTHDY